MNNSRRNDSIAVAIALSFPSVLTWTYFVWLRHHPPLIQQSTYLVGKAMQFALPVIWYCIFQRRALALRPPRGPGIGTGASFGLLVVAAMFALYQFGLKPAGLLDGGPTEQIHGKVTGFGVDSIWKYAGLAFFYSTVHSFLEEYYWRWFVFGQLRELVKLPAAVLISSLGFMAHHVLVLGLFFGWLSVMTIVFSASIAVGGAVWAWLYDRTNSLYGPWISHLIVDAGIFAIGFDLTRELLGG